MILVAKKDKRILITGASGFVGKRLISFFVNNNYSQIYAISRDLHNEKQKKDNVSYISCDLEDSEQISCLLTEIRPHYIYHLAADTRPSRELKDLHSMIQSNIMGTTNLLSSIVKVSLNIECVILAGTCEEYGLNNQPFDENMVVSPISMYSGTKAAANAITKMFHNLFQVPIVIVRPSLIYGPGQSERFFIPQAIGKLLNHQDFHMTLGEQTRDFIYIDDVVEGLVRISECKTLIGETVNLAYGSSYSLKKIVDKLFSFVNSNSKVYYGSVPYRPSEIMSFDVSNQKLFTHTGWKPQITIEEGIDKTVAYSKGESF
ncbi:hypothetical protein A8708_18315 [Paenibacillus oryzisoli]|uniref:NAD(P)-binding domain-containing protein n=1 Tax=Paenibacillus oryzisoli TaxID=1850517 RepID=A0A198AHH2_9BACL|nr:hypothetical protein A8708_18315 [Paenibacillus oryzisoli]